MDQSLAAKRKVDTTPIVLDIGSSNDEEEADEMIQVSETAVKKETEAGEGKEEATVSRPWTTTGTLTAQRQQASTRHSTHRQTTCSWSIFCAATSTATAAATATIF